MKRLISLTAALSCLCLAAAEKPNIVFVLTDDQGYGDLGCTGNPFIKTPHMDALAAESSTLDDYHVAPTCSPSRAALLTGHWTNRTGVWHTIMGRSMLRDNEVTLGQLLKDNGYKTGMFGKWHLGDNYPYRPEDRGFIEVYRHAGGGVGQTPDYWNNAYFDGHYIHNSKTVPAKGFCTDVFFEAGNSFIRKSVAAKKPFFAYISTNAPHGPFHCPKKYMDLYPNQKPAVAAFFGMITNIDENLGKTRALIKQLGVYENTIFIFSTDNGSAMGAPVFNAGMRGAKGQQYDGGHRVPFFLHWPKGGMNKKHTVTEITHAIDIVPTLLEMTGSTKPADLKFDGKSIRSLLDPAVDVDWPARMLITDSQRVVDPIKWRKSAVMSNRWRLIDGVELYDIKADPAQATDIAKKHPEQLAKMRAFYDAWWAELEPSFAETTEIYVGQPGEEKVTLTAHDWLAVPHAPPWNQAQVRWGAREGRGGNMNSAKFQGHWAIKVIEAGEYEISIMRYPVEAKTPIRAAIAAGENVPGASRAYRSTQGLAFPFNEAVLKINDKIIAKKPVTEKDLQITFTTKLSKGSHKLAPVFLVENGGEIGAYYAVIRKK